jgi:hypothetical protein
MAAVPAGVERPVERAASYQGFAMSQADTPPEIS